MLEKKNKELGKGHDFTCSDDIHSLTAGRLFSVYDHSYKQQKYSSVTRFLSLSIHRTDEAPICIFSR